MKKKLIALMLAASMVGTLLVGCGNEQPGNPDNSDGTVENTPGETNEIEPADDTDEETGDPTPEVDISEHVVLTVYCIGDEGGIYAEDHIARLNEVLTEKINAEIQPIMVSWGDYRQKLPMAWASGETYDLTYTSNWTGYYKEAENGAFMDITELFPEYAPLTFAELSELDLLESTKVNGKLYMVPNNLPDYTTFIYNYREDLRKKYDCPEIVDRETLEIYLDAIKENEPSMIPFGNSATETMNFHVALLEEMDWAKPIEYSNDGIYVYDLKNPTEVFNVVETPEYAEHIREVREYYEKGYWSQSIMADTTAPKDNFIAGKVGIYLGNRSNSNLVYQTIVASNPDWEVGIYSSDMASGTVEKIAAANNGMAVGAHSQNPERALMFIELCYQDEEIYDLVMYGLEGVTYEADKQAGVKWNPEGVDPSDIGLKNLGMGFGNQKFYLASLNDSPLVTEMMEEYETMAVLPGLAGFSINTDEIGAELAAIKSICDEYKMPLEKGVVDDPEKGLEELKQKLQEAGADKVLEEINRQIAEYWAGQQ